MKSALSSKRIFCSAPDFELVDRPIRIEMMHTLQSLATRRQTQRRSHWDALPFGRVSYGEPHAVTNAINDAQFYGQSHDATSRVYDAAGDCMLVAPPGPTSEFNCAAGSCPGAIGVGPFSRFGAHDSE